jgi:hypothetical protein
VALFCQNVTVGGGTLSEKAGAPTPSSNNDECGIYLAQSTIPNAGLGMFAGKDYKKNSKVTDGDIIVPLIEVDWNNDHDESWIFLWDDYTWARTDIAGMDLEEVEGTAVSAASMGIGAAINCRISMVNVEASWNKIDSGGLHRSKHPGAGAITPYHDRHSVAVSDIPAGHELFISYGKSYFTSRRSTYGLVPLLDDFPKADYLLRNFTKLVFITVKECSFALKQDLFQLMTTFPFKSRVINALPTNMTDIPHVLKVGTGQQYDSVRNLPWLRQHGACADHMRPGPSTIPGAGRGAFATRPLAKGTTVAPAPLLHITNKTRMTMYDSGRAIDGSIHRNESQPVHEQLLVNYCFGHANSSLLLSSYGVITGLINHSSKNPNVRLEWSNIMMHSDWCDFTLEQLSQQSHAGLVFDYVALRDIQRGEEILLNYGIEWERAWNQHLKHWKPPKDADTYVPAYDYENDPDCIVRTIYEEPYSPNVLVYIHEEYRLFHGLKRAPTKYQEWHRARVLDRYQNRNKNTTMYMVEIFHEVQDDRNEMTWINYDEEILFGVERDAFQFLDEPYTRDHSLHSSFRHAMMIPDDMFPEQWKNLS